MIIVYHTPICPECKALLLPRSQGKDHYYFCADCMQIFKVLGPGKAEIELVVTDREVKE